jgi:hypothetical protein
MNRVSPASGDLAERPELAALHLLDATLVVAEASLLAAHPVLEHADFFPQAPPLDPDTWIADAIVTHICALQTALQRYHAELRRQRGIRLVRVDDF